MGGGRASVTSGRGGVGVGGQETAQLPLGGSPLLVVGPGVLRRGS